MKGLVYRLPCAECSWVYIGETSRALEDRLSKHKRAIRTSSERSEVAKHVLESDHRMDFDGVAIVCKERTHFKRIFKEAWVTHRGGANKVFHSLDSAWEPLCK